MRVNGDVLYKIINNLFKTIISNSKTKSRDDTMRHESSLKMLESGLTKRRTTRTTIKPLQKYTRHNFRFAGPSVDHFDFNTLVVMKIEYNSAN